MPRLEIDFNTFLLYDENGMPLIQEWRSPERDRMMAEVLDGAQYPVFANAVRSLRA